MGEQVVDQRVRQRLKCVSRQNIDKGDEMMASHHNEKRSMSYKPTTMNYKLI